MFSKQKPAYDPASPYYLAMPRTYRTGRLETLLTFLDRCAGRRLAQWEADVLEVLVKAAAEDTPVSKTNEDSQTEQELFTLDQAAELLYEAFGDSCPCNFNGNDEWLPSVCRFCKNSECPDPPDKLDCWREYIRQRNYRPKEEQP